MTHGSLFSGIGGFDLAAEWMGWDNKFHCEWNPFGQKVLKHYWPNAESFGDITKTDFTKYYGTIDLISGGFPCQPYSSAGDRKGKEDERHLWPEMCRAIREIAPRYVVGENVRGLTDWNGGMVFDEVCSDLENLGYQVAPYIIPACAVNAPHKRERLWVVAYSKSGGRRKQSSENRNREDRRPYNNDEAEYASNATTHQRNTSRIQYKSDRWLNFPTESPICSRNDELSNKLDGIAFSKWRNESMKAYGNAVLPIIVYQIFKAIEQHELLYNP